MRCGSWKQKGAKLERRCGPTVVEIVSEADGFRVFAARAGGYGSEIGFRRTLPGARNLADRWLPKLAAFAERYRRKYGR